MDKSWNKFFDSEKEQEYFKDLMSRLDEEYRNKIIYPEKENLFRAFKETKLDDIKVDTDYIMDVEMRINNLFENYGFDFDKVIECRKEGIVKEREKKTPAFFIIRSPFYTHKYLGIHCPLASHML